jgi:chromosomal replication initiation ATPase DnaA
MTSNIDIIKKIKYIADYYSINPDDLLITKRKKSNYISDIKFCIYYYLYKVKKYTLVKIALLFKSSHNSVLSGINRIDSDLFTKKRSKELYNKIVELFEQD